MKPTKEYGYLLIDTPEKKRSFSPKVETDEFWHEEKWKGVSKCTCPSCFGFSEQNIYRRRKDPGEGFEIVPPNEVEHSGMEYFEVGSGWVLNITTHPYQRTVKQVFERHHSILAFRRRKSTVNESLPVENDDWISVRDQMPPDGSKFIGCYLGTKSISICTEFTQNMTHWRPMLELPKDPADVAFEEADKKAFDRQRSMSPNERHLELFNAGREFERSRK